MHRIADEFTCTDCGRLICSVPPRDPPPTVCMTVFIAEFVATRPSARSCAGALSKIPLDKISRLGDAVI